MSATAAPIIAICRIALSIAKLAIIAVSICCILRV